MQSFKYFLFFLSFSHLRIGKAQVTTEFPPVVTNVCSPGDAENDAFTSTVVLGQTVTTLSHIAYDGTSPYPDNAQNYNCNNDICMDPTLDPTVYELVLEVDETKFDVGKGGGGANTCGKDRVLFGSVLELTGSPSYSSGQALCNKAGDVGSDGSGTVELIADASGCISITWRVQSDGADGTGWSFDVFIREKDTSGDPGDGGSTGGKGKGRRFYMWE